MIPRCSETCNLRNSTSCSSWAWLRSVRELGRFSWGWVHCCCEGGRLEEAFSFCERDTTQTLIPLFCTNGPQRPVSCMMKFQSTETHNVPFHKLKLKCHLFLQVFQLHFSLTRWRDKIKAECISPSRHFLDSGSSVSPPSVAAFARGHHFSWTTSCSSQTWVSSGSLPLAPALTGWWKDTVRGNTITSSFAFYNINFHFKQKKHENLVSRCFSTSITIVFLCCKSICYCVSVCISVPKFSA